MANAPTTPAESEPDAVLAEAAPASRLAESVLTVIATTVALVAISLLTVLTGIG